MDEDYSLTGTRARAVVRESNAALAAALGLPLAGRKLPVVIDKKKVWLAVDDSRRAVNRAELAELFANPAQVPGVGFGQRLYLEWHYRAPANYQFTLEKQLNGATIRLLGWNRETELTGAGDFMFFTGLLGCTGLCAVAADGSAFMSHWDEFCNPRQLAGYAQFAARHPGGRVYVVGVFAGQLAAALRKHHPGLRIDCHHKAIFFETTYTVRFKRSAGKVTVDFYEADVADDYIVSCHHTRYGKWFTYGRFGQACPGPDQEFRPCEFVPAKDDPGPPIVDLGERLPMLRPWDDPGTDL